MNWALVAGWIGSAVILLTYLGLTFKIIPGNGRAYQISILLTSLLYGYMNWKLGATPAIPINVLFGLLSIIFLIGHQKEKDEHNADSK